MRGETPGRMTLDQMTKDYDWQEVFAFANNGEGGAGNSGGSVPKLVLDAKCSAAPFSLADVAVIVDQRAGENDGPSWMVAGVLNDGRAFFIEAGCDYTGWDCQASGTAWVADDLAAILRWGMTDEAREHLPAVHAAVVGGLL